MAKLCQICKCELTKGYKYCEDCRKAKKREYVRNRYKEMKQRGEKRKRYGIGICIYCGKKFILNHPEQLGHGNCRIKHVRKTVDNYNNVKRSNSGNTLGRQTILNLGFTLTYTMVIHHKDEDPNNNKLSNLIILNRKHHASLHRILEKKLVAIIER